MLGQRFYFVERQGRIELPHLTLHRSESSPWIAFGPRDHTDRRSIIAQLRTKQRLLPFLAKAVVFPISTDPDDFPKWLVWSAKIETLADCLLSREKSTGEGLVHNCNAHFHLVFQIGEVASP